MVNLARPHPTSHIPPYIARILLQFPFQGITGSIVEIADRYGKYDGAAYRDDEDQFVGNTFLREHSFSDGISWRMRY